MRKIYVKLLTLSARLTSWLLFKLAPNGFPIDRGYIWQGFRKQVSQFTKTKS
jgi:hypothetical protein